MLLSLTLCEATLTLHRVTNCFMGQETGYSKEGFYIYNFHGSMCNIALFIQKANVLLLCVIVWVLFTADISILIVNVRI